MRIKSLLLATITAACFWNMSFAETSQVIPPKIDRSIGQHAYLRDKLPEETIAYIRISHPFMQMFSAKNRTNNKALQHQESVKALQNFREVLGNEALLTAQIQKLGLNFSEDNLRIINYIAEVLYQRLNGPFEGMVFNKNREISLSAEGVFSIPVNIESVAGFNEILAKNPLQQNLLQLDHNGFGVLEMGTFYFSPKEQKLFIAVGLKQSDLGQMKALLNGLKTERTHEMYAYENQIDITGQGNFFWVDLRNQQGMLSTMIDGQPDLTFLRSIQGIAAGSGTNHHQQGQVKLIVKTDPQEFWGIGLQKKKDFSFKTVGVPKGAVILPIPTVEMIKKMIESYITTSLPGYMLDSISSAEKAESADNIYQKFQQEWIKVLGFDFEEILAFLGTNITFYYDDLGLHSVIAIHDKKALYQWLAQKNHEGVLHYSKDRKIHHITIQNPLLKLIQQEDLSKPEQAGIAVAYPFINEYVANIYGMRALDLNWHLYFGDDDDYIRLSALPQIVEEENKLGNERFDRWLTKNQGINSENVFFAATIDWKNADRYWYYNYLQFLQNSADLLGTSFDVTKMPRADQMSFADSSRLGMQVTTDKEFISFSLDYGSEPNSGFMSSLFLPAMMAPLAAIFDTPTKDAFAEYDEEIFNEESEMDNRDENFELEIPIDETKLIQ